ncbi:conserved exported hypothetical protein [Paraburkholderia piptadeniae]|uniref:Uncharacterized protein n=1 Tax=Paraburkholderia piptadeniae TaxID=1701573 RepID=A0A1N7RRJ6_9BURK|nr:hypothetical protein [Paraburkholderia piptadeniae]SIT37755.1 conserved exported hypothetical protein [Paraburkholderia piptadeniae]
MNAKLIRVVIASVVLAATGTVALAAGTASSSNATQQGREYEHGSMMGGMMGMNGMMGSCPMMGGTAGMDPKTAMRMHGEMMRAMGDIMLKYAEQAGTTPSK